MQWDRLPLSAALVRSSIAAPGKVRKRSPVTLRTIRARRVLSRSDGSIHSNPFQSYSTFSATTPASFMVYGSVAVKALYDSCLSCSRVALPCRLPVGTLLSLCEPFEANRAHKTGTTDATGPRGRGW